MSSPVGRTLAELTTPIAELNNPLSPIMPPVQEFDAELLMMESTLQGSVPELIRERVRVIRNLAVYGSFSYDFFTVSVSWAYSTIEMALSTKFTELEPTKTPPATMWPLVEWAIPRNLLPSNVATVLLAKVRNVLVHPRTFNQVHSPEHATGTFEMLVDILNTLWPKNSTASPVRP